jgi:flagellar hook-associated protein 1 FlgK
MSLTLAYNIARGGLAAGGAATAIVSRNVANANNPSAAHKSAVLVTGATGGVHVASVISAVDDALFERAIVSASARSELEVVSWALEQLGAAIGDPEAGTSAAALIGGLRSALQAAAGAPHDEAAALAVISAAVSIAGALNETAGLIARVRGDANSALGEGVANLSGLLNRFETANREVVTGTSEGRDVTDLIDGRNGLIREIADLLDIRATTRAGNDVILFLANGATLFETIPRLIAFDGASPLLPGEEGAALRIDGVRLSIRDRIGGRLGGLLQIRDELAPAFGRQVDEIARGLIVATAESDQSTSPSSPDLAGLFTYPGGPVLPAAGVVADGLASVIRVNSSVDPSQAGVLSRLRDGGIADPGNPSYVYNGTGAAGYSDRLRELIDGLAATQPFDPAAGLAASDAGVLAFAVDSAGWLEQSRATSRDRLEDKKVLSERALGAWQSRVGIDVDDELTALIALERSYQATTRLITSVNGMFDALLRATG